MVSTGLPPEISACRGTLCSFGRSRRSARSRYRQRRAGRRVGEKVDDRLIHCRCCHWRWDPPGFRFTLRLRLLRGVIDAFQVCKPSVFRPISYPEKGAAGRTPFAPAGTKRDLAEAEADVKDFEPFWLCEECCDRFTLLVKPGRECVCIPRPPITGECTRSETLTLGPEF